MSTSEITIVAIMTPKPDKIDRVQSLLQDVVAKVEANEPDVLMYRLHKEIGKNPKQGGGGGGAVDFVFTEKYKDSATLKKHGVTDYFQDFQRTLAREQLLEKPAVIKVLKPVAGFESRAGSGSSKL